MRIALGMERKVVPQEYADFLLRAGGTNPFGEANFIVFWGQTRVMKTGFGEMLEGHGMPAWILAGWRSAEDWGDPYSWDYETLGPYPTRGKYEIIQPFYKRVGKQVEPMPLNYRTLECLLPIIIKHRADKFDKRKSLMLEAKRRSDQELEDRIADRLQDSVPQFQGPTSFAGQRNKHTVVQQKIEQLERQGNRRLQPGLQQFSA